MDLEDVGQTIPDEEEDTDRYEEAPEVEKVAQKIIGKYHSHLVEAKIHYLFRKGPWTAQNRETWGKAAKVTGVNHYLTGFDFIITVSRDVWDELTESQREALVDHQLEHCNKDTDSNGNPKFNIIGHDIEDFVSVIDRHGFWTPDLAKVKENDMQGKLFDKDGETEEAEPERPHLQAVNA
jgi:hypothetical protein